MKLLILISTFGPDGPTKVSRLLLPPRKAVQYLVSWQPGITPNTPDAEKKRLAGMLETGPLAGREDVAVQMVDGRGLSANRNHTIDMACRTCLPAEKEEELLVWFMDDDVALIPEGIDAILESFSGFPSIDGATFQILTPEGDYYKEYGAVSASLKSVNQLRKVSSIEIVLRLNRLKESGIRFDERFGAGSRWICSEEFLFLTACLRSGMTLRSFPFPVAVHPKWSSVNGRSPLEDEMVKKSGAVNAVLYGFPWAYFRNFLSLFKAHIPLKKTLSFLKIKNQATSEALFGMREK